MKFVRLRGCQTVKISLLLKSLYTFNTILVKILIRSIEEIGNFILKLILNFKGH